MEHGTLSLADSAEKDAEALIAIEKVKVISKEGILIDNDTPYAHTSTNGGKLQAFIPRRIKSGSSLAGLFILIAVIVLVELLTHIF